MSGRVTRLVKEPLFHFLILGLAIYAGYAWLNPGDAPESDQTIVVGAGELGWMRTSFEKRWNRPPTTEELEGLTKEYVRETAFYREALAMGLDQDDTIVRRRLAQKLEFLVQDLIDVSPPTDAELEAYFDEHRADYRQPDLITFTHAFVDPDKWGNETESHAASVLEGLKKADDPTGGAKELGDPFMLQLYYPERTEAEISKLFGGGFAQSLGDLSLGAWQDPVLSGYGVHLVYVHAKETFPDPAFANVRDRVAEDWMEAKREELNDEYRERLLEKYTVVIEDDAPSDTVAQGESSP
ncbi:MAG: peptidyl-prolyl cis-trans isomerase [Deltaproteobacteria bacterium]|nr:peptidyl-prolyl cis-trans isomerase [Deltaproteobacteria bacterium]MBW2587311.1 peptidyl-prolyl cis-trans isomerase [Deltaproteobacteria bacterium]MBW2629377.1 peptidyl-prolyl cis-trans isomerase [Deltaproteobacteria bacterium]